MIAASTIKCIQEKRAYELHMRLCAKIEQAIVNAAMDSYTELLVQLPGEIQSPHFASIRLESSACDIERLQFILSTAGYEVDNTTHKRSFMIKW